MFQRMIYYSPREAGGGAPTGAEAANAEKEGEEEKGPRLFQVGDQEVTEEELLRGYKGTRETTQRFQQVAEREKRAQEREALMDRRFQELEERERRLNSTRDDLLASAASRKDGDGESPRRQPLRERLKEIDFVGTENAGERVGALFEEEWEARQRELEARHNSDLQRFRAEVGEELKKTRDEAIAGSSRSVAQDRIERQNRETFDRVLAERFPDLRLTSEERALAEQAFRAHIGPSYGAWDGVAALWIGNDRGAEEAIRSSAYDKLLKAEIAKARGEGLQARERGERATESTPGRSARPSSTDPDQALLERVNALQEAVRVGAIDQDEALRRYREQFSEKDQLRHQQLIRQERIRKSRAAAARG